MAVLEVGINLGLKNLVEIKYYSQSDNVLDSKIRAKFLTGLKSFISEVYEDKLNVIAFSGFQIVCYYKLAKETNNNIENIPPLLVFAIIEKETDPAFVKKHLKEISRDFIESYDLEDIFSKESNFFQNFKPHIDKILGDLRLKIEDRIDSVFS